MKSPHADSEIESLDHKSSRAICDAVGQRLQHLLRPEPAGSSSPLEHLLDELRRRDEADGGQSH